MAISNSYRNKSGATERALIKLIGKELTVKYWFGKPRETFLAMFDTKTAKQIAAAMAAEIEVLEKK